MPAATKNLIALAIIIFVSPTEISAFSKYGRSCQDIGCRSDEKCTMMETSCTLSTGGQCGPYPSCIKDDTAGKKNCRSMNCPTGQYCKTENGRAVCKMASTNLAPAARRPPGDNRNRGILRRPTITQTLPTPRTPLSRTSSDWYPVYPGNSIGTGNKSWRESVLGGGTRDSSDYKSSGRNSQGSFYPGGSNNYNTHVNTDSQGNRLWTFSRNRRGA